MRKFLGLLVIAVAFVVAGCAADDQANDYRTGNDQNFVGPEGSGQSDYHEVAIPYQGRTVYCIRLDTGSSEYADSGLSCDWVRYHQGE